jgi:cyclopropane fatty-acyl-phospholipid synthase-like methyltransferase
MSELRPTLKPDHFEALYAADPDPWNFEASPYERAKYKLTLDAIPSLRSRSALEVGCSIGVLTRLLVARCDSLLAVDAAQTPLIEARRRCADLPDVHFERMFVPEQWPDGVFDLILLSEVVYYLSREDVGRLARRVRESLAPGGAVVLVHWIGSTDYPLSGDEAVVLFLERMGKTYVVDRSDRYSRFRLDVLSHARTGFANAGERTTRD